MILPNNAEITGIKVKLSEIEKKFSDIWKNTTGDGRDKAVVKASTLNLIITINDKNQYLNTLNLIPEVTFHNPCRIIMILINPELDTERITSYISAFCQPPRQDGVQLCSELITLETGNAGINHLPGILLPLLLPDLPVFLWSPNNLFLNNFKSQDFHKNIERVILYSPETIDSIDELYKMAGYVINASETSKISDMTWARLTGWREAVARFFDFQEREQYLNNISKISIEHFSKAVSTHAYLMAGWIASRLDWTPVNSPDNKRHHFIFTGPSGNQIDLFIKKAPSDKNDQCLSKVEIQSLVQNRIITFSAVQAKNNIIKTIIKDQNSEPVYNYIQNAQPDNARLLCYELDFIKKDTIYIEAVEKIWQIFNENKRETVEIY
ncbi:glucose-6-phosphate dehydrogenase assembly protein OpcA [candidate division KSB1 bacterium]|nr:glucose-6-phosphate dehydrogenase assembly protein OpcA [candidate division KSB1 bacterium]